MGARPGPESPVPSTTNLRARDQLVLAAVLGTAAWFAVLRVAETKNEAAVGGGAYALDGRHPADREAFGRLLSQLSKMGDPDLADRLEALRARGELWVAPRLGPERWAVFVETVPRVRRVYIRREALLDPVAHLYGRARPDIPRAYQDAHAWLGVAGALRHELAHHDGVRAEAGAYDVELAWYEARRHAPFLDRLSDEERRAWEWGIESAVLSARKARETATGLSAPPSP